jgi:hypothetical protein
VKCQAGVDERARATVTIGNGTDESQERDALDNQRRDLFPP